tara:strand:- start:1570 stop:2070 length:501 start_codon:yes stop_codon:yes gene_type:complete
MYLINKNFINLSCMLFMALTCSFISQGNELGKSKNMELTVYKTPSCGCCKKWLSHVNMHGIDTNPQDFHDLENIKSKFKIKPNLRSCHTAVSSDGFVFEGHVPAKFIHQFLSEDHGDALGLSVPAMPLGSPGMEVGDRFMPYQVLILFNDGSSQVYAQVNSYKEQF